ncbi:hypothetical protein EJB05_49039 [Eragrostis curvula]|uniref:Uncharacterized protein n=1 Tax=Eragrostis curvula TaxID=38414 RepID=A0A5J9T3B7_9POAL|nr:hypothetical protein EJB05_49039 [Eragrostis curvula]
MAAATAADAGAMGPVISSPPLERGRPEPAAGKALVSLWLAGQWVAGAALATAVVARRAWGVNSPVFGASFKTCIGAFLFSTLILLAVGQENLLKDVRLKGGILRKIFLLASFAWAPFIMLVLAGALVMVWYVVGSQGKSIGLALVDVGFLGISALSCLVIIPTIALEVWKTKAMGCCISEKMTRSKVLKDQL